MTDQSHNKKSASNGKKSDAMALVKAETKAIFTAKAIRKLTWKATIEYAKVLPVVGPYVDLTKVMVEGLINIEREERELRLINFMMGVVQEEDYDENTEFREGDVLSVIRKLMADDESEKTEYYTRLAIRLGRMEISEMPADVRSHFIRMISELTCYQIEYAREFYIRNSVPLKGYLSFSEASDEHLGQPGGRQLRARSSLLNWGLLTQEQRVPGLSVSVTSRPY